MMESTRRRPLRGGAAAGQRYAARDLGRDALAGLSVAFVLVPQSLAYAELAGMPPDAGLRAAAVPALAAALYASSPYLQTGPTATASLLTLGALSSLAPLGSPRYIALAGLLALLVGAVRVAVGLLRLGQAAYLLSRTVLLGFTSGAALLIVASQIPAALGARSPPGGVLEAAAAVLARPGAWDPRALMISAFTAALVVGGRRVHRLFPGVLVAVAAGTLYSAWSGYDGPRTGAVAAAWPALALDLPWSAAPALLLPALVIALVGFAEPASIARTFAAMDRQRWDADREFVSQGMANVAAGVVGGLPVGASFSRSALDRSAGARSRLSGAATGLAVLLFLPFAGYLAPLPRAVLGAIVIASVLPLIAPRALLELWRPSRPQFLVAAATFALTLALAPRIEQAVLLGSLLAVVIHLWRELRLETEEWTEGEALHLRPIGVLWFGTANTLEEAFLGRLGAHPEAREVVVHLDGLGRLDLTGAQALRTFVETAGQAGVRTELRDVPHHAERLVGHVLADRR